MVGLGLVARGRGERPGERPPVGGATTRDPSNHARAGLGGPKGCCPQTPKEAAGICFLPRNRAWDHFGALLHPLTIGDSRASSRKHLLFFSFF